MTDPVSRSQLEEAHRKRWATGTKVDSESFLVLSDLAEAVLSAPTVWYCYQAGPDPTKHQKIRVSCFTNRNHPGSCGYVALVPMEDGK